MNDDYTREELYSYINALAVRWHMLMANEQIPDIGHMHPSETPFSRCDHFRCVDARKILSSWRKAPSK